MLKPPNDVKQICFYTEKVDFPIAIYPRTDWEVVQISYLKSNNHTSESLVDWCKNRNISYQIIYSLSIKSFFENPKKSIKYIKLVNKH